MQDGVYKATFHVGSNSGDGIVTISGNKVSGGDFGFIYFGTITEAGDRLEAQVEVRQHNAAAHNVFAGLKNFTLSGQGAAATSTRARITGTTPAAPGASVIIDLFQLAPL